LYDSIDHVKQSSPFGNALLCIALQVRGEEYDQVRAMKKKSKQPVKKEQQRQRKDKSSSRSKKAILYEAGDLGTANDAAVHMGLGDKRASMQVKNQIRTMNMPLGKRFQQQKEKKEEAIVQTKVKGGTREITYVPLDTRKKLEAKKLQHQRESSDSSGRGKRQRRGIKDLGFKTPFQNT
jgi:hypothetical protein